jgi:hypothetical protein
LKADEARANQIAALQAQAAALQDQKAALALALKQQVRTALNL